MKISVVDETNRYSVENNGRSVNTSCQELEKLIGMYYYMGLVQMPSLRSYWESELCYEHVAKVMSRDHFLKLVTVLWTIMELPMMKRWISCGSYDFGLKPFVKIFLKFDQRSFNPLMK
jgi:hypothetical protein